MTAKTETINRQTTTPLSAGDKAENPTILETCPVCGKPTKMIVDFFGIVTAVCDCYDKKRRAGAEAEREYKAKAAIEQNKIKSFMDEKARKITFETIKIDDNNRDYVEGARRYCNEWADNFKHNRGLLFYGKPGRGKTTIACCIANKLLDNGVTVKMMSVNALVQRIKNSFNDNTADNEAAIKDDISAADLLILDDLGAEYKSGWTATLLYELIDERYRSQKPAIITTNLSLERLREHLADENGIPRAYDRIVEIMYPVEFTGVNYRIGTAKQNNSDYNFFTGTKHQPPARP